MPSPIPVTRLMPKDLSLDFGACSSPLAKHSGNTLTVPPPRIHGKVATRLWSSVIHWKELKAMHPIGSGGFGSVYKAGYLGETVAVKKVKKRCKNKLASRQSFWAELNAAHLRHQNIVRVVAATTCIPASCDDEDNIGTIIMEYVGSRNLHYVIYGCADALGLDRWARYALDVAHGLCFLHSHGIAHCDLKPANVLLSDEDICKIVDFGSSLKLDLSQSQVYPSMRHVGGTYTHTAPELLKGENASLKVDIYSFGITLWQLVTRQEPYTGDRQHVLYAVVAYDLRPSMQDDPFFHTSRGVACRTLMSQCWSRQAHSRPSAHDVIIQLNKLRFQT